MVTKKEKEAKKLDLDKVSGGKFMCNTYGTRCAHVADDPDDVFYRG